MLTTIKLDDDARIDAKIDDVLIYRRLPSEFQPVESAIAQPEP